MAQLAMPSAPFPPHETTITFPRCICCTVRGDLIKILNKLIKRRDSIDAVLVETTGLADPAPVAQTFFVDDNVQVRVYVPV